MNFARARSYVALRGFGKIGGVLLGLDPTSGDGPDVIGLDWTVSDKGVTLKVSLAGEKDPQSFGPFRAAIIRQALAYAADGRLVAATMPQTAIGRQVLLHPALINSALGCEARVVDQFVDCSTSSAEFRAVAEERVYNHLSLYALAWATQFSAILDSLKNVPFKPDFQAHLDRMRKLSEALPNNPDVRQRADKAVAEYASWLNKEFTPVQSKPDFFDSLIVASLSACLGPGKGLDQVLACTAERNPSREYVTSGRWLALPPELRAESGVREQSYVLGGDLDFLDLQATRADTLWPFDFMLQVTFDFPPASPIATPA